LIPATPRRARHGFSVAPPPDSARHADRHYSGDDHRACTGTGATATPTPSGFEGIGSGPAGTTGAPTTKPPTTTPPSYPVTARAYAESVLAAWKQKQIERLGDLATPEVQEQIIEIPGPPNQSWTYQRCDGLPDPRTASLSTTTAT